MAEGLSTKEVARRLNVSYHTVKGTLERVMKKLGAHSRTEAVAIAVRRNLINHPRGPRHGY